MIQGLAHNTGIPSLLKGGVLHGHINSKSILKLSKNYFGHKGLLVHILRNPNKFGLQKLDLYNLNYVKINQTSTFEFEQISDIILWTEGVLFSAMTSCIFFGFQFPQPLLKKIDAHIFSKFTIHMQAETNRAYGAVQKRQSS